MEVISWYKYQLRKAGVTIKMHTNMTPEKIIQAKPDAVILGLGGTVVFPTIPGMKRKNVMDLTKLDKLLLILGPKLSGWGSKIMMPGVGKRVVIMGGEHHGCEIAEWLIKRNRKLTICHTGTEFAEGMTVDDKLRLMPWFEEKGVALYPGVKYKEVTDKGLIIITRDGKEKLIEADTVMPSLFLKQNLDMEAKLKGKVPEVYTVGSCVKPEPDIMADATSAGAKAAFQL
jgi:2,4-dienoyl-CoA reductase (NADPH2)